MKILAIMCVFVLFSLTLNAGTNTINKTDIAEKLMSPILQDRLYALVIAATSNIREPIKVFEDIFSKQIYRAEFAEYYKGTPEEYISNEYHQWLKFAAVEAAALRVEKIDCILRDFFYASIKKCDDTSEVELYNNLVRILIGADEEKDITSRIVTGSESSIDVETSILRGPLDGMRFSTTFELRTCNGVKIWLPVGHEIVGVY